MLINGLPVDIPSLELYELLDRISAEVRPSTCAVDMFLHQACPTVGLEASKQRAKLGKQLCQHQWVPSLSR